MRIKDEEENLANVLEEFLVNGKTGVSNQSCVTRLNTALSYLLSAHLRLCENSTYKQYWIDDIEWTSLSLAEDRAVVGMGKIWFGKRQTTSASLQTIDFDASFRLLRRGSIPTIGYMLSIEGEGREFKVRKDYSL